MNRTSISDLKAKAKDQLLGNYKTATGSFALLFALVYAGMSIIMSAFAKGGGSFGLADTNALLPGLLMQALSMITGALSTVLAVGYIYMMSRIAGGERPAVSDLFFVFKNHPDKVIIISLLMSILRFVLLLPADFIGKRVFTGQGQAGVNGRMFLLWVLAYLAGMVVIIVVEIMLAMCYMIYLDDTAISVGSCIFRSISMMKGNKFRYFYMLLTFLGYWLLIIISLGIAALWVVPYQTMTTLDFYYDLKGDEPKKAVYAEFYETVSE